MHTVEGMGRQVGGRWRRLIQLPTTNVSYFYQLINLEILLLDSPNMSVILLWGDFASPKSLLTLRNYCKHFSLSQKVWGILLPSSG